VKFCHISTGAAQRRLRTAQRPKMRANQRSALDFGTQRQKMREEWRSTLISGVERWKLREE